MNLFKKLCQRHEQNNPIRIALIGAGKFGSMYLSQIPNCKGVHITSIIDLDLNKISENLLKIGWPETQYQTTSIEKALKDGSTFISEDWEKIIFHPSIEIIIECTGNPIAAVKHSIAAFENKKHVINVTVEADAVCGLMLAKKAELNGVTYSLAYGDQPALATELVDWAKTSGFPVIAAGRGHKWLPQYRESTPDTVWKHWGLTIEQAEIGGLNPKMFNAFLDGSKPAIESAAIANATGLNVPQNGLAFPPGSIDDIPTLMRPIQEGGVLEQVGLVEVISSIDRNGIPLPYDIRKGVWVCIKAETDYIRNCFKEYKVTTDPSGQYMGMYRRWHMIGLELGVSVASIGLRNEPTGVPKEFNADVVATCKRKLNKGEILDGEGGYMVFGKLCPAHISVQSGYLPLGLASGIRLKHNVKKDQILSWNDVDFDTSITAYQMRKEQEKEISKIKTTNNKI